ncbi:MAG: hypothetical protein JKY75_05445 [Erythrobacter sp.]|jgi:hypothetical protein|nr:hypothetical protein [Erythrobacter sp.]
MWIKCISSNVTPDIEKGGKKVWEQSKVYEVSEKFGSWLIGCYERNFEMSSKPKAKAKEKSKAKPKAKG